MAQFTTAQVAEKFDTNAKTLRKFLRADARDRNQGDSLPGKGSRYAIEGKDLKALKTRFTKWQAAEAAARAARAQEAAKAAQEAVDDSPEVDGDDD